MGKNHERKEDKQQDNRYKAPKYANKSSCPAVTPTTTAAIKEAEISEKQRKAERYREKQLNSQYDGKVRPKSVKSANKNYARSINVNQRSSQKLPGAKPKRGPCVSGSDDEKMPEYEAKPAPGIPSKKEEAKRRRKQVKNQINRDRKKAHQLKKEEFRAIAENSAPAHKPVPKKVEHKPIPRVQAGEQIRIPRVQVRGFTSPSAQRVVDAEKKKNTSSPAA